MKNKFIYIILFKVLFGISCFGQTNTPQDICLDLLDLIDENMNKYLIDSSLNRFETIHKYLDELETKCPRLVDMYVRYAFPLFAISGKYQEGIKKMEHLIGHEKFIDEPYIPKIYIKYLEALIYRDAHDEKKERKCYNEVAQEIIIFLKEHPYNETALLYLYEIQLQYRTKEEVIAWFEAWKQKYPNKKSFMNNIIKVIEGHYDGNVIIAEPED